MNPHSITHLLMLVDGPYNHTGDHQQQKVFLSSARVVPKSVVSFVVFNSIAHEIYLLLFNGEKIPFFVCAADWIVACDGLANENTSTKKTHKDGKGIWEIGQKVRLEVMRRALC